MFFLLSVNFAVSQNQIQGKVIDRETNTSLSNTSIYNLDTKHSINTDKLGQFILKSKGNYRFKKDGYEEKTMMITSSVFLIVQLNLKPLELNEVIVNANQIPKVLKKSVTTIEVLSKKEINRGNDINISQILNRTPGVFVQSGALNTNRLTIRGIGSRNLFGTSKIRAYFKDIPLTNGSGETTIEDFELGSISRIEIVKGATSSIYGAGLGGAIHLIPLNAYLNETSIESQLTLGSFGLVKSKVNFNQGSSKNSFRG
jgi:iron complex outermembrane receptor protein